MGRPKVNQKISSSEYSVLAAEKYINLFHHLPFPSESQKIMLASAHHTLSTQKEIPLHRAKMHSNTAITLLQNMKSKNKAWALQLANAYYKRAELLEQEQNFQAASHDFERAIRVLEYNASRFLLNLPEKLLLAQSAIAIADLLLKDQITAKHLSKPYALFYVNKALEYLARIPKNEDIWITLAYAHHTAGLAFSSWAMLEALEAFRTGIAMAMKVDSKEACLILGDIYKSMGRLYQNHFQSCPIQNLTQPLNDYADIYLGIAIFFKPSKHDQQEEFANIVDAVFDTIYHALDPFLYPLPATIMRDFIDALIYVYYCLLDQTLPNQALCQKLSEPDLLSTFAQHIYWLVAEDFRREHSDSRLVDLANPETVDYTLELGDILGAVLGDGPNNVLMFKKLEKNSKSKEPELKTELKSESELKTELKSKTRPKTKLKSESHKTKQEPKPRLKTKQEPKSKLKTKLKSESHLNRELESETES